MHSVQADDLDMGFDNPDWTETSYPADPFGVSQLLAENNLSGGFDPGMGPYDPTYPGGPYDPYDPMNPGGPYDPWMPDYFDPIPYGYVDLMDPLSLEHWVSGLQGTGEVFYQEWADPWSMGTVWALSVEVNPWNGGSQITQVIDMQGNVYNGHFGIYWQDMHGVQADDFEMGFDNPDWTETSYPADPMGMSMLFAEISSQEEAEALLPIVKTFKLPKDVVAPYYFHGSVLTDGGAPMDEVGFLFSQNIGFKDAIRVVANPDPFSQDFFVDYAEFEPGQTYYYRAFGRNRVGETEGALKKLKVPERLDPNAWWSHSQPAGGEWRSSDWFGLFRLYPGVDWTFHAELGWIYPSADGKGGLWFWTENEGWLWTQPGTWPYLWRHNSESWLFYFGNREGGPLFWDYQSESHLHW
jgi:hypothetical protein